jgi:peptide alpha-N-acetyltransferase
VTAIDVVTSLLNSQALKADLKPYDISQLILYKARLMMESGGFSGALDLLNAKSSQIKNRLKAESRKAEVLIELGRLEDAKRVVTDLLQDNSENSDYHALLRRCLGLDELLRTYLELAETFPASNYIAKSVLRFSAGAEFAVSLDKFLKAKLRKGVPSVATDLKTFYSDSEKAEVIAKLLEAHRSSLRETQNLASVNYEDLSWAAGTQRELPTVYLWTLYLSAWHCYFTRNYPEGLAHCEAAILHTGTLPDLYLIKAKIVKRQGLITEAAEIAEQGRDLDMNDRYLSNYTAKLWLRAGNVAKADEVMLPFCKEIGDDLNVHQVQNCWYEVARGQALLRVGEVSKAGVEFRYVWSHFQEYWSSQFDYHNYCLHRVNMEEYLDFIKFLDGIFKAKDVRSAGVGLLQCKVQDSTTDIGGVVEVLAKHYSEDSEVSALISQVSG